MTAGDLSADPAALALEFILSMYKHGPKVIDVNERFLSPDLVAHFAGDPKIFPFAGTHIGIEAARVAFAAFYSVIQPPTDHSEIETFHSEIETFHFVSTGLRTLVWGDTWAHPIGMPMPGPIKLAIKMDFRDGLMTVLDDRFDTLEGAKHFADAEQA